MRSGVTTLSRWLGRRRTGLLTLGGFGSLSAATWTWWGMSAGLAAIGGSLLAMEALGGERR